MKTLSKLYWEVHGTVRKVCQYSSFKNSGPKYSKWWPRLLQGKAACAIAASRTFICQEHNLHATKTMPALTSVLGPEVKIVSIMTLENPVSIKWILYKVYLLLKRIAAKESFTWASIMLNHLLKCKKKWELAFLGFFLGKVKHFSKRNITRLFKRC